VVSSARATKPAPFKAGDRVRATRGPAKGHLGTIVEGPLPSGGKSIYPMGTRYRIWVQFDAVPGKVLPALIGALEHADPITMMTKKPPTPSVRARNATRRTS